MNPRRLTRSRDRQLAGVAGGMADYLGIDPTIVRVLWILSVFVGGFSILLYIILAFVMPQAPAGGHAWAPDAGPGAGPNAGPGAGPQGSGWNTASAPAWGPDWASQADAAARAHDRSSGRGPGAAVIVGVVLIVFGAIALADNVLPGWIGAALFWPGMLIALGAALLVASLRRHETAPVTPVAPVAAPSAPGASAPVGSAPVAPPAATWDVTDTETSVPNLGPEPR